MQKNLHEEKEYLAKTLERFLSIIEDTELRLDALPRMYRDNPTLLANLMKQYNDRLIVLKKTQNKPYFARIDFCDDSDGKETECYIGKVGVSDENNKLVTVDWRAPIASMYYDSNIGRASYQAPKGTITGELKVKRQYNIEEKELLSFQDVDTVSNDEILKPYLGVSADNRLKNIVATIQSEQNEIIRQRLFQNSITQGVAGSGKTTVALHRIAYLVYNNMKDIKPEQYLVIGPNKFFVNYISGVLPDLDVNNVSQLTYEEVLKTALDEEFQLIPDEDKLVKALANPNQLFFERLRVSMVYKNAIDKFLSDFDRSVLPTEDFSIKGYKILPNSIIKEIYEDINSSQLINYDIMSKKLERAYLLIGNYIENYSESISSFVHHQFSERFKTLSGKDVEKERKAVEYIEKELRNRCNQSLKKYFSKGSPKILSLYMTFLQNIKQYINVDEYNIESFGKKTASNIKSKKVEFEDLGALLYLSYRIYGSKEFVDYRHAVIDEAQDFGEFNFFALKQIMPKCSFSIFGDLAQSIYQYRGVKDWESVIDSTFGGDCDLKYLKKSYRTTTEIMNSANNITDYLGLNTAEPVIRHGLEVEYSQMNHSNQIECITQLISQYLEKGYSSIAIITKNEEESTYINSQLQEYGISAVNISTSDKEYHGGICTIPSYLSKGLEFDGVIISDASDKKYQSDREIDMKLLYVAMTRPLHELNVLYNGNLALPLQNELKKTKKLN